MMATPPLPARVDQTRSAIPDLIRQLVENGLTIDSYSLLWTLAAAYGCRTLGELIADALERSEAHDEN